MALVNNSAKETYVNVLGDGSLRVVVPEGTEGAVKREYETSDGKTGVKYELVFTELSGLISKIGFWDGDYGKILQLTINDGAEEPIVLCVNTASNFGEDLMKKLPNVDLEKPVKLVPYAFDDDKGKKRKGITIYQGEDKVKNYYYDEEKKVVANGYPEAKFKKKVVSKDDWKLYFLNARMFLIDEIVRIFKIEEVESDDAKAEKEYEKMTETPEEDEDIPFDSTSKKKV